MTLVAPDAVIHGYVDVDLLLKQASRLWAHARQVERLAQLPYVSRDVFMNCASLPEAIEYVYLAGTEKAEREPHALHPERTLVWSEFIQSGGHPDTMPSRHKAVPCRRTGSSDPPTRADVSQWPLVREFVDGVTAHAAIRCLGFALLDREVKAPPSCWPRFVREPVSRATSMGLVGLAYDVAVRGMVPPLGESVEGFLKRFTRRVLRLHPDFWPQVTLALVDGRWMEATNPVAYVITVAKREQLRADGWLNPKRSRDVYALDNRRSLDAMSRGINEGRHPLYDVVAVDPIGAFSGACTDPYEEVETRIDLELAIQRSGIGEGGETALYARLEHISRREAPEEMGLSRQDVERGWKDLQRKSLKLRKNLSA